MALSQETYRERRGCPTCDAPDPLIGFIDPEREQMRLEMTCLACGQVWDEVYTYQRYELKGKV